MGKVSMSNQISSNANEHWRKTLLPENATLQDAVRNLDKSALQITLVISADETFVGTITDGDIRRGLLRGLNMNSPIETVIHHDPMVVPPEFEREQVFQLMRTNKIQQLPVVNNKRRVAGLHILNELIAPKQRSNTMVIMAGGKGTRLRPYTEDCPKPLLPVSGKPMLEHIIERARLEGFNHFVLAIHYLGHMIEDYCGDGSRWDVKIDYLKEESPLGTAGAIGLLTQRPDAPFLVTNGDVLTDIHYGDLLDFHVRQGAAATMAVRLHEWQHPYGIVHTEGIDITGFEEKPVSLSHVNAGIYVLEPAVLDHLTGGEHCDMPTLFERLQKKGERTIVYPMHELWLDVGRPEDYMLARTLKEETA